MKEQLETILKDYYEESGLFLVGLVQDQKNPANGNFILTNPHKSNQRYKPKESSYFISVEHISNLADLQKVFEEQDDQFL